MHKDFHFERRQHQGLTLITPGKKVSDIQADSLQFSFDRGVSGVYNYTGMFTLTLIQLVTYVVSIVFFLDNSPDG